MLAASARHVHSLLDGINQRDVLLKELEKGGRDH
jgi:hypothetical protein